MTGRDGLPVIQDTLDDVSRWLGLPCLLLTHVTGAEQIVIAAHDEVYGISAGDRWAWAGSLCSLMVTGEGPNIVADTAHSPYSGLRLAGVHKVGAYVGVPITHHSALYGTLAAFAPEPEPIGIEGALPIVQRLAELLAALTQQNLELMQVRRTANAVALQSQVDSLTKVGNRYAWERALDEEETRCRRFSRPAAIIAVDLDRLKEANDELGHAAGDELLVATASVLQEATRACDKVARVGGDEFGVLAVECAPEMAETLRARIQAGLEAKGIEASIGLASRSDDCSLVEAWARADEAMYDHKRLRAARRLVPERGSYRRPAPPA